MSFDCLQATDATVHTDTGIIRSFFTLFSRDPDERKKFEFNRELLGELKGRIL